MVFNELEALKEIKNGKKLKDFHAEDYENSEGLKLPTSLMVLCALTYHGNDAYLEVPDEKWSDRASVIAVENNYRAIRKIPDVRKTRIAKIIAETSSKVKRNNLTDYMDVINQERPEMLKIYAKFVPGITRFLAPEQRKSLERIQSQREATQTKITQKAEGFPEMGERDFQVDYSADPELSSPEEIEVGAFLNLPVEEQTYERLQYLIHSDMDLPDDFIKRITIPNRNAAYYAKNGDMETAEFWKKKIIPYLNKAVCEEIAEHHPEGSLNTKGYIKPEYVKAFWERKKQVCSKARMTGYFMKFPENLLDRDMAEDIQMTTAAMKHAPSLLKDHDAARKYLNKHPYEILKLPEYQNITRILAYGVPLNEKTVGDIADPETREKIMLALNIGGTGSGT